MGLVADDDFAFAFSSFEEAVMNAGHRVASDWLRVRQEREEPHNLLPDVVEAIETEARSSQPSGSREVKLEVGVTRRGPMRSGLRPQSRLRLRPGPDQPEQVQLRVNGLKKAFREAGALRPAESMDAARTALWSEQLDRLAKEVVTVAEPVTVLNGLKTWTELRNYLEEKERPFPPDHLDIYGYLKDGTKAPARAHASLRWFVKQGKLAWDVGVALPAPRQERRPNEQACAVEPPMIPELEERIQSMCESGDPRWLALLSAWIQTFGILRYKHIQRAIPVKVTNAALHARCQKGKQHQNRKGFDFIVPGSFCNGWGWIRPWLEAWQALPADAQQTSGLCFTLDGKPWSLSEVTTQLQDAFAHMLVDPTLLTSYSWRRACPTFGQLLQLQPLDLAALGDWVDRSKIPSQAAMPLHYSSARYDASKRIKFVVKEAFGQITGYEAWAVLPQDALQEALAHGRSNLDRLLNHDARPLWSAPLGSEVLEKRLRLTTALKQKVADRREEGKRDTGLSDMPSQVNGKVLSRFMKSGQALCGAFQTRVCTYDAKACAGLHRCAVMRNSGRVCGGGHAAIDCYDKKFMRVESFIEGLQHVPQPSSKGGQIKPKSPSRSPRRPRSPSRSPLRRKPAGEPPSSSRKRAAPSPALPVSDTGAGSAGDRPKPWLEKMKLRAAEEPPNVLGRRRPLRGQWL